MKISLVPFCLADGIIVKQERRGLSLHGVVFDILVQAQPDTANITPP
jgi:hypothetical protein